MVSVMVPQAASIAVGAVLIPVAGYRTLLAAMAAVVVAAAVYLARGREEHAGLPGPARVVGGVPADPS